MKTYLFYDEVTGEDFFVEVENRTQAMICARHYFQKPYFIREVTRFEAEMMGLDTY